MTDQTRKLGFEELEPRVVLSASTFVQGLYREVLHRNGSSGEVSGHLGALDLGVSRSLVAQAFLQSPERLGLEVRELYNELLHRSADPGGLAGQTAALVRGASLRDIAEGMLLSAEYQTTHPDDSSFIRGVFEDALHRTANEADLQIWLANAARGGRGLVADGVLGSVERGGVIAGDFYFEFLHRDGSRVEREAHASRANSERFEDLASAFVLSPEFEGNVTSAIQNGSPTTTAIDTQFANLPVGQQRTFAAAQAGSVTIVRTGAGVGLIQATPAAGWSSEIENDEPNTVDVNFRNGNIRVDFDAEVEDGLVRVRVRTRNG